MEEKTIQDWQKDLDFLRQLVELMRKNYEQLADQTNELLEAQKANRSVEASVVALDAVLDNSRTLLNSFQETSDNIVAGVNGLENQIRTLSNDLAQREKKMEDDLEEMSRQIELMQEKINRRLPEQSAQPNVEVNMTPINSQLTRIENALKTLVEKLNSNESAPVQRTTNNAGVLSMGGNGTGKTTLVGTPGPKGHKP